MDQASQGKSRHTRREERRELILNHSIRLFNENGVRGTTLADIAARVGLDLTSLRYYFTHKDDIAAAAFIRSIDIMDELIRRAAVNGRPQDRMQRLVAAFFDLRRDIRGGNAHPMMQFGDMLTLTGEHADKVWARYGLLFRNLRDLVSTPQERVSRRMEVSARAHILQGQLSRTAFWLAHSEPTDFARSEARFTDILLKGLASGDADWPQHALASCDVGEPAKRTVEPFLEAATELINTQGYHGASVRAITEKLNLTKGAFYHHLDGKDDLLAACFDRTYAIISSAQLASAHQEKGVDRAAASVSALTCMQVDGGNRLLRPSVLSSAESGARESMLRRFNMLAQRFSDMVSDGVIDGSVRPCDPRIAGQMLLAQVHAARELVRWVEGIDGERAVEIYVRPLFYGLFGR